MDEKDNLTRKNKDKQLNNLVSLPRADWLAWSVFISAIIIGGFFIFNQVSFFDTETQLRQERNQLIAEYQDNVANPDNTPHAVYEQARQALLNNDLEGVLETIHLDVVWRYEDGLKQAAQDGALPEAAELMVPLTQKVYDVNGVVIYETEPVPGNENVNILEGYRETVEFTRDQKGFWKISSI